MTNPSDFTSELRGYVTGFCIAIALTVVAFGLVELRAFPRPQILIAVFTCAIIQVIIHFVFFLHVDLRKSKREDLQLILFSSLIILFMAGGTLIILSNLAHRMM